MENIKEKTKIIMKTAGDWFVRNKLVSNYERQIQLCLKQMDPE